MKTRVSALIDGELEDHEVAATLQALRASPELRGEWCDCHVIGAALRGERALGTDLTARVMAALEQEPTVMAPKPVSTSERWQPALALAASAAGVALVAWLALAPASEGSLPTGGQRLAAATPGAKPAAAGAASLSTPRLQEYLVAHRAHAPGGTMMGGARNIRTVAASGEGR